MPLKTKAKLVPWYFTSGLVSKRGGSRLSQRDKIFLKDEQINGKRERTNSKVFSSPKLCRFFFFFLSQEINSLAILPETNHVYCSRQERTSFILNFTHTINFTYLYLNREPIRKKFCLAEGPLTGPLSLKNA